MARRSVKPSPRGPKRRPPLVLIVPAAAALAAVLFLVLRPEKEGARVARLWAAAGVEKPNVILITLDTTRADHLPAYGYSGVRTPALDALAGNGVVFDECAAASPLTLPSHATIMTGTYPTHHGVRVNGNTALGDSQTTLAEVLAGRGYRTGAFIGAFVLDGRWGLKQGFEHYDDAFDLKKYKTLDLGGVQRPGNQVMDAALAWLEGQKNAPFFAWIHLYDPHSPYEPPEPFRSEYGRDLAGLYDGEIAFMDAQIGRCTAWLRASGLEDKTILVLVGDHGEGLGSHGEGTHGFFIYEYAVHVPLVVATPLRGLRGVRVGAQASTADVFPTILELARVPAAGPVNGRSLVRDAFRPRKAGERTAYGESMAPSLQFGWSPLHSLRTTRYKFIEAPRPELYDLARDPGEKDNLVYRESAVARTMKAELDRLMAETGRDSPAPQAADLDKDTLERLAALGYIGAPVAARKPADGKAGFLADPKDKLPVFEAVQRSGELVGREQYAEAASALEAALREEPAIPQALLLLATCYTELGRKDEAKARLDTVLKDDPQNIQGLIAMANILMDEGRTADVIALGKRTLAVDDKSTQAQTLVGEAYMADKNYAEALPYLEKAAEIQPKMTQNLVNLGACLVGVKDYGRAETVLGQAVREAPKFPLAQFNLGLLLDEQGRLEEARAAYAAEIAAYPKEFTARFNLGKLLLRLGDRAGYIAEMREVVAIAPRRAEGPLFLARGLLQEGASLDEVEKLVARGLDLAATPDLKALGYYLLADVYNRRHQTARMNDALRKAKSLQAK